MSNLFNSPLSIQDVIKLLGINSSLDTDFPILAISDSNNTINDSICDYVKGPLPNNKNGLVLISKKSIDGYVCLIDENPQECIVKIINYVQKGSGFKKKYQNAQLPSSVVLGKNVVIEDNVEIGEGTIIQHNVVIHSGTKIGINCLIRTNSSIGGDGFGFFYNKKNQLVKQPHLGGVTMGKNVEVGSNTCVVRGIVNDTIIDDNVKIDNLVHIAHDCKIGCESLLTACAELSGYVSIGKKTSIAPNTTIKQRITIGDNVVTGMGAVIFKNVADNAVVVGNPAKPLRQFGKKT